MTETKLNSKFDCIQLTALNSKLLRPPLYARDSTNDYCSQQTLVKNQHVMNCAARVIFCGESREHVTASLRDRLYTGFTSVSDVHTMFARFYRAMHFSAKRGIAIACRLSVRPSVCLSVCLSVCNVGEL